MEGTYPNWKFTRAAENLLSNLTKNLSDDYKTYVFSEQIFKNVFEIFLNMSFIGKIWL